MAEMAALRKIVETLMAMMDTPEDMDTSRVDDWNGSEVDVTDEHKKS